MRVYKIYFPCKHQPGEKTGNQVNREFQPPGRYRGQATDAKQAPGGFRRQLRQVPCRHDLYPVAALRKFRSKYFCLALGSTQAGRKMLDKHPDGHAFFRLCARSQLCGFTP
jgi:hypothetical protein